MKPAEASVAVSAESGTQTTPSSAPSAILGHTAQSDQAPAPTQMAAISSAPTNAPTMRDYGWLSEAILRRVEELKRYPASARVDHAEGKVVVKAAINEDGSIGEVEVFQSSGHPGLDKAAVETMREAAPFHLPRPLGQPRMTIKIPMSYRLDR
jgi:protein TonB